MELEFRLKELRDARGLTQQGLALELNLSQNSISRFERGKRLPDYYTLIEMADYFDVSLDYLTGRTDKPRVNR